MGFLGFGGDEWQVRREYEHRIQDLLREFSVPGGVGAAIRGRRSWEELVTWCRSTWERKRVAEADLLEARRRIRQAEIEIDKLKVQLGSAKNDLAAAKKQHEWDMREQQQTNDLAMTKLASEHHQRETALQKAIQAHIEEQQRKEAELNSRIRQLTNDIMVNQKDSRAWTDEKLKERFVEIRIAVDALTSPHSLARDKSRLQLGRLDPSGFLGRAGAGKYSFLAKNLVWGILLDSFFTLPFGFGALGSGDGQAALLGIYLSWQRLFNAEATEVSFADLFAQNLEANQWRSATFESILAGVLAGYAGGSARHSLVDLYVGNMRAAADRIVDVLSQLAGQPLDGETIKSVQLVSRLAAEMGLQIGVQPSKVFFVCPERHRVVEIGKQYHHCMDGDADKGRRVAVDLVVVPGLVRVGDGKRNLEVQVLLSPCEIYPDGGGA